MPHACIGKLPVLHENQQTNENMTP